MRSKRKTRIRIEDCFRVVSCEYAEIEVFLPGVADGHKAYHSGGLKECKDAKSTFMCSFFAFIPTYKEDFYEKQIEQHHLYLFDGRQEKEEIICLKKPIGLRMMVC